MDFVDFLSNVGVYFFGGMVTMFIFLAVIGGPIWWFLYWWGKREKTYCSVCGTAPATREANLCEKCYQRVLEKFGDVFSPRKGRKWRTRRNTGSVRSKKAGE